MQNIIPEVIKLCVRCKFYAEDMKEFGLERGLEGGQARHKDIKNTMRVKSCNGQ